MNIEKQLDNQKVKKEKIIKRPWQANVWIGLTIFSFFVVARLLFWNITCPYHYEPSINYFSYFAWDITLIFSLLVNPFSIIVLLLISYVNNLSLIWTFTFILLLFFAFLISGFLKSIKKFVWGAVLISSIRIILFIYFLFEGYSDFEHSYYLFYTPLSFFILFILLIFILYLEISCLKHPFYNQKKIK